MWKGGNMDQLDQEFIHAMHQFHKMRPMFSFSGISRGKIVVTGAAWQIYNSREDHKVRVSEIVSRLGIPAPGVSRILKGLEEDGIVMRSLDPEDRRTTLVSFTDKGMQEIQKNTRLFEEALHTIIQGMGEEKIRTLCTLLNELYAKTEEIFLDYQSKTESKAEKERL
jgi:DNA-binding MarR family transcriptional regulator